LRFGEYLDTFQYYRRKSESLKEIFKSNKFNSLNDIIPYFKMRVDQSKGKPVYKESVSEFILASNESFWTESNRPYYEIYPSVIEMLLRTSLKFELNDLRLPMGFTNLLLKFPMDSNNKIVNDLNVQSVLLSENIIKDDCLLTMTCLDTNFLKKTAEIGYSKGENGEEVVNRIERSRDKEASLASKIFRMYVSICLIGNDPEFIEQCVLSADERIINDSNRTKLQDRAVKRGKFGFKFGSKLEMVPHIRSAHMCWVRYGKGRNERKYVLRKGSIIHRNKIEKVPTGFEV
jgi:hypothetical protein